jgi:hypothetical protein
MPENSFQQVYVVFFYWVRVQLPYLLHTTLQETYIFKEENNVTNWTTSTIN